METCCICLEDIDFSCEAVLDSCKHKYCHPCIQRWVKDMENSCPQCKIKIRKISFRDVLGRLQSEEVIDKVQEVDNFEDMYCAGCNTRVYERNFDARNRNEDTAAICEECLDFSKHLRCMTTLERDLWDQERIWYCQ